MDPLAILAPVAVFAAGAIVNFVTASRAGQGAMAAIVSMSFVVWGVLVVIL